MQAAQPSGPKRTHRKRVSALRLSTDTTSTLPEYIPQWQHHHHHHHHHHHQQQPPQHQQPQPQQLPQQQLPRRSQEDLHLPSDKPPDYPDSAEEADEDTDSDSDRHNNNNTNISAAAAATAVLAHSVYIPHAQLGATTGVSSGLGPGASSRRPSKRGSLGLGLKRRKQTATSTSTGTGTVDTHTHASTAAGTVIGLGIATGRSNSSSSADSNGKINDKAMVVPVETSTDPYLDALLERSVHALEISNTLLKSSISKQTGLSSILSPDEEEEGEELGGYGYGYRGYKNAYGSGSRGYADDMGGRVRTRGVPGRMRDSRERHEVWADDLEEIRRGVDGLFDDHQEDDGESRSGSWRIASGSGSGGRGGRHSLEGSISASLPTTSPVQVHHRPRFRRHPSLEIRRDGPSSPSAAATASSQLRLTPQLRSTLVAPAPRALTQYVASSTDPDAINLPSTLGLRAASASYHCTPDWRPLTTGRDTTTTARFAYSSTPNLHATLCSPQITTQPLQPSTPAYNMLSTFVQQQQQHQQQQQRAPSSGSTTPSASFAAFLTRSRRGSSGGTTERSASIGSIGSSGSHPRSGNNTQRHTRPSPARNSPEHVRLPLDGGSPATPGSTSVHESRNTSRKQTPKQLFTPLPLHRAMTPPTEESSSSSDGPPKAKLTIVSLRKILDEQPLPVPLSQEEQGMRADRLRPPAFLPRSPAPVAEAGTSTATASISRLFTKATHSSSTRPPSPPRHSAMKRSGTPSPMSPSPVPSDDGVGQEQGQGGAWINGWRRSSAPGSGRTTPKRISFAELPESYAGSRPGGSSAKFKERRGRRKGKERRRGTHGEAGVGDGEGGKEGEGGWWSGWLMGAAVGTSGVHGAGIGASRQEERFEDRMSRNFAGRMSSGFGSGLDEWAI